jgi:hypothetical protein
MPTEKDKKGPEELSDSDIYDMDELLGGVEDAVESDHNKAIELLKAANAGKAKKALDMSVRLLECPESAHRLSERHNAALISHEYIELLKLFTTTGETQYEEGLKEIRASAKKFGFFLFEDAEAFMAERLQKTEPSANQSQFVIAEAFGRHPDSNNELHHEGLWSADCQIQIPADSESTIPVVQSPDEGSGDVVHNLVYADVVDEQPESVAIIEDIVCDRRMAHLQLASLAMSHSLEQVINGVNPKRLHKLGYVAAEIASVTGVILPRGKEVTGHNGEINEQIYFDGKHQIFNGRSMHIFEQFDSPLCSEFKLAFQRKDEEHDIVMPDDDPENPHKLIVTWNVMIAELEKPEANA